jgi:TRAP-type C4-dicarboxylate transport system substrate-binding protein
MRGGSTIMHVRTLTLATLAVAACGSLGGIAVADPLKFRVADVYPVGHTVPNSTIKVFMEDMKKRLGDRVQFEYYPSEQLGKGKDLLSLTQNGVVDIGLVVPSYVSDKMPLSAVSELPGAYKTSCEGTHALHQMVTKGTLEKSEFGPNKVHVLITHSFAPFQAFSTKPYQAMKSFEGQKLRTLGLVTDLTIKRLGAVPIRISAPEINEAMSRGTIDGGLMGIATVVSYDLTRYLKSATYGESFGGTIVTYAMSDANWKKLPTDVKDAMTAAGEVATRSGCEFADAAVESEYAKLKTAGVSVVTLSPEDRKAFDERMSDIGREWAETLDKRGKPGSAVLSELRQVLKTN